MIANNEKRSLPSDDYRRCWTTEEEFDVDVTLESWGRTHSEVQAKSSQEQAPSLIARGRTTGRSCEGGLGCCSLIQCIVTNANATQQQIIEKTTMLLPTDCRSVCESVGREWRTDWVWGEFDLVKGTGKLVRADPDPPVQGGWARGPLSTTVREECLSCEPYKAETSRERAIMRCAKGKHYYFLLCEHVCIFTSSTAVYFAPAGEETLKW
jgi:hypothetical protein